MLDYKNPHLYIFFITKGRAKRAYFSKYRIEAGNQIRELPKIM